MVYFCKKGVRVCVCVICVYVCGMCVYDEKVLVTYKMHKLQIIIKRRFIVGKTAYIGGGRSGEAPIGS